MCGISMVCEQLSLTPRAVRFYELRGLVTSRRDKFNCRVYDRRARARLEEIAGYRQAGLSIDDILELFALESDGEAAKRECAARKLRARITELEGLRQQAEQVLHRYADDNVVLIGGDGMTRERGLKIASVS
jgi:DNA-binding transcriptional MerR regulator